jgi:CelD/BcsL family acetyltransferase involved in cellulose biosynthesis
VSALQFLGSGVAGSDDLDLIVRRGDEEAAVNALADELSASGRTLALMRMRTHGTAALLVDRLQQRRWHAWRGPTELCPYAPLTGHTFDSYLSTLSAEHRYGFRRKLARLERKHSPRFELVSTHQARRRALATLFALHDRRWQSRGEAGAFATQGLRAFHEEVSARALDAGWLKLWVLHLEDEPVAALYGFLRERKFLFYQAGFDPLHARNSVGMVLLGVAIRDAIGDGADELDLLHGTERYKAHWTRAVRELSRVELHAPGTRGFLEREATALTRGARRMTRAALELGRRIVPTNPADDHAATR